MTDVAGDAQLEKVSAQPVDRPGAGLSRGWTAALVGVFAVGLAIRIAIAWHYGPTGDQQAFLAAARGFRRWHFDFYSHVNAYDDAHPFTYRNYSYPPLYLPWFVLISSVRGVVDFWQLARVPPIVADIALAWLVQRYLRDRRNATPLIRVASAAAILLGPTFIASSALEAQIDSIAILPAVVAVMVWEREHERRGLISGLLIGVGAAIKTMPMLLVLALLPTATSARERLVLLASAAAVPGLSVLPFALADPHGTFATLRYGGFPGGGGIATVVQPTLVRHYLGDYDLSGAIPSLQRLGWLITVAGVAVAVALLLRWRVRPVPAACVLFLVVYATSVNWYPQYLAWGFPFFLMNGWVSGVLVADVMLLLPITLSYRGLLGAARSITLRRAATLYWTSMTALWTAAVVTALTTARTFRSDRWRPG